MPSSLKRSLTYDETDNSQRTAEQADKRYVVWKHGRSTHFTHGLSNGIKSDFKCAATGLITDEWAILDTKNHANWVFSAGGDSGSLVWDSEGFVNGLLWGGRVENLATYVTPIEAVIDDIKKVCGTNDVYLVVRDEDKSDKEFPAPPPTARGLDLEGTSEDSPLFGEDNSLADSE
jgi:hypothetical protein